MISFNQKPFAKCESKTQRYINYELGQDVLEYLFVYTKKERIKDDIMLYLKYLIFHKEWASKSIFKRKFIDYEIIARPCLHYSLLTPMLH